MGAHCLGDTTHGCRARQAQPGWPSRHERTRVGRAAQVFVEKLHWVTSTVFLELLALAQCLPGPTSTQVSAGVACTVG